MKPLEKRTFRPLFLLAAPSLLRRTKGRLASLGLIVLILLVVAVVALRRPGDKSRVAVASADSLVTDSTKAGQKASSTKGKKKGKNEKKEEPPVPVEITIA